MLSAPVQWHCALYLPWKTSSNNSLSSPKQQNPSSPSSAPPWWLPRTTTNIELNKDTAQTRHNAISQHQFVDTLNIYTDGSNIDGKVGAAAFSTTLNKTSSTHLGSNLHFNIFAAELEGINIGLKQWNKVKQ